MEAPNNVKEKFVGKSEEIFLTQFAFDVKVEELKSATNPSVEEKKITVHVYGNDKLTIAQDVKAVYDTVVQLFRSKA